CMFHPDKRQSARSATYRPPSPQSKPVGLPAVAAQTPHRSAAHPPFPSSPGIRESPRPNSSSQKPPAPRRNTPKSAAANKAPPTAPPAKPPKMRSPPTRPPPPGKDGRN